MKVKFTLHDPDLVQNGVDNRPFVYLEVDPDKTNDIYDKIRFTDFVSAKIKDITDKLTKPYVIYFEIDFYRLNMFLYTVLVNDESVVLGIIKTCDTSKE